MALGMMTGGVHGERGVFYTNVDAGVLLAASAAAYGVLTLAFRASAEKHMKGLLVPVTLVWGDRRVRLTALCDTGNALRDPVTGYPVLVAESLCLRDLFPSELRWIVETAALQTPVDLAGRLGAEGARFRLIPYHAVGVAGAMLLAVRTDWGEVGGKRYQRLMVALSPTGLGNGFTALWGAWEEHEKYGNFRKMHSDSMGKIRNPAAENRILHMRK